MSEAGVLDVLAGVAQWLAKFQFVCDLFEGVSKTSPQDADRPCSVQRLVYDAKAVLLLLFGSIHDGVTRLTSGAASSVGAVFVAPLVIVERLLNANICVNSLSPTCIRLVHFLLGLMTSAVLFYFLPRFIKAVINLVVNLVRQTRAHAD